jgi:hypothetical protein
MKGDRPFKNNLFKYARKFGAYTQKHGLKKTLRRSFEKLKDSSYVEQVSPVHAEAIPIGKSNTLTLQRRLLWITWDISPAIFLYGTAGIFLCSASAS